MDAAVVLHAAVDRHVDVYIVAVRIVHKTEPALVDV